MSNIHGLNLDPKTALWSDVATCRTYDEPEDFFDNYENDKVVAASIDEMCLSCPVMRQCYRAGRSSKSYGVWGGVHLEAGKPSKSYNSHKTPEIVKEISKRVGENVKV